MGERPLLSIVVTSYTMERLKDILELLDSIKAQTYPDIETIFVAERSQELKDRIDEWAHEKDVTSITTVFNTGEQGLSSARNLGIKHSRGDIVAFVDDDVVLFPDWAEEMVNAFKDDSIIGATGSAFPLWENESMQWLPEEFYWLISCTAWTGWKEKRIVRGAFGANMAFRSEAFEDGCLFSINTGYKDGSHHQPVSDDLEFSLRVRRRTGKSILFSPGAQVWHRAGRKRLSLGFVTARAYQIGRTRRIIRQHYDDELGPSEQEEKVLRGMSRVLRRIPGEFLTKPGVAWKKLLLTGTVFISVGIGYLVPAPSYSLTRQEGLQNR